MSVLTCLYTPIMETGGVSTAIGGLSLSLTHALLGVLTARPMSGYDLLRFVDGSVGSVWSASHSQIYPELRRMDERGLLTADVEIRGTKLQKRVYSVTDAGLDEL